MIRKNAVNRLRQKSLEVTIYLQRGSSDCVHLAQQARPPTAGPSWHPVRTRNYGIDVLGIIRAPIVV